jgi:hypothetical protein
MPASDLTQWYQLLPESLRKSAYTAAHERAWRRQDALKVVDILSTNGYVVLGVDIWLATDPGPTIPTPFVYDWSLESALQSGKCPKSAAEFIRTFEWDSADVSHEGREPYFNILAERLSG